MTAQPAISNLPRPEKADTARPQVEKLVSQLLMGREIDVTAFAEGLLVVVTEVGALHCAPVSEHGLRFELAGSDPFEVELDMGRGKLRMVCARLAVLCQENGYKFMPYGGEGVIRRTAKVDWFKPEHDPDFRYVLLWKARWINTPGQHEFTLTVAR